MPEIKRLVDANKEAIIGYRRELHKIPETAFKEEKTSAFAAKRLRQSGLDVQTGIARFGVVGLMSMNGPGKTVLLRADMDALPIVEETGLSFASTHKGNMNCNYSWKFSRRDVVQHHPGHGNHERHHPDF